LIIRADDLRPGGLQVDRALQIGPLSDLGGSEIGLTEAGLEARIQPWNGGLICKGRVRASVRIACARCLETCTLPVDREFEVVYRPAPPAAAPGEREMEIAPEDLNVGYLGPEKTLDLSALVAEQIYLELPMKPLCTADCRGLCPGCGANLNAETCTCRPADEQR